MSAPVVAPGDLERAARLVEEAEALLITAGAGMGVDSGMPEFRGDRGFWTAYPPYRHLKVSFIDMANPQWFVDDPSFAWGFYGHRRNLYRTTPPHAGFDILRRWAQARPGGAFVFTSNVDGHFQRAGFDEDRIVECHGSIEFEQCTEPCGVGIYPAGLEQVEIDEPSMRAAEPLPRCPGCGALSRPNILMFGDGGWEGERELAQSTRLQTWLAARRGLVTVIECGAGTALPTVRMFGQRLAGRCGALIRINPREAQVPAGQLGLRGGALAVLEAIDARIHARGEPPARPSR